MFFHIWCLVMSKERILGYKNKRIAGNIYALILQVYTEKVNELESKSAAKVVELLSY